MKRKNDYFFARKIKKTIKTIAIINFLVYTNTKKVKKCLKRIKIA